MRVIVTAGPTREHIDSVRFITNASSGRMGYAVALAAARAGHRVTILSGPVSDELVVAAARADCEVAPFITVPELRLALEERFGDCDALVMAAAVGDFRPQKRFASKLRRSDGPITVSLLPTEDVLAEVARSKRPGQIIVAFAVEAGEPQQIEAKARREMKAKNADYVVLNTPEAMSAKESSACILSASGMVLPWAWRCKEELAGEIVKLLGR
jgi:phosphopantothenoylcysteine decarboxylase/phosphopantothenate--cysteine ligase